MRVRWLRKALLNLAGEAEYLAREDPVAAGHTVARISEAVERLVTFPALGRPGRVVGTRELVVSGTPYILPYRVHGNDVEILRVFHAARKWPARF